MDKRLTYIVEIPQILSDETTIYLEADGNDVKSLFAIVEISDGGASIVDNGYRTIGEAQTAWPEAVPPNPYHLTPNAVDENCNIGGETPSRQLRLR